MRSKWKRSGGSVLAQQPFDGRVPPPEFAAVETTRYCNLRCRMCLPYLEGSTVNGKHMDLATFESIASDVFPFIDVWQPSVSGEPTMSRGFTKMLEIAGRYGVKAEMVTNATLFNDKMVAGMAPHLAKVYFSFDAADAETFESIREGADYEKTLDNIKKLVRKCRETLPERDQPVFGINCTIMERNIRGLPDLVELAARELELDFVTASHVFPVTVEMKRQSLCHHVELAVECIDEALERARRNEISLYVLPLDQLTAATARADDSVREISVVDGVVEGLERREYGARNERKFPKLDLSSPEKSAIKVRRQEAWRHTSFPEPVAPRPRAVASRVLDRVARRRKESIWWCSFLWQRTYLHIDGDVRPCCVSGVPSVGNTKSTPFEEIWNDEVYRALRQRMVVKRPVGACKGCQHIQEITSPLKIERYLGGREIPRAEDLPPLPASLASPVVGRWIGWILAEGRDWRVALQLDRPQGQLEGRVIIPGLASSWVELSGIEHVDYDLAFESDVGGRRWRFEGRLGSAMNALDGTWVDLREGAVGHLRVARIASPEALGASSRWSGSLAAADGPPAPFRLSLGAMSDGHKVGWCDWPEYGIADSPVSAWSFERDEVLVEFETSAGFARVKGEIDGDRARIEGSLELDGRGLIPIELARAE